MIGGAFRFLFACLIFVLIFQVAPSAFKSMNLLVPPVAVFILALLGAGWIVKS